MIDRSRISTSRWGTSMSEDAIFSWICWRNVRASSAGIVQALLCRMRYPHCRILPQVAAEKPSLKSKHFLGRLGRAAPGSTETSMNDNDEIAVTMWRALKKADTPEAGGIVLAKLVATWLGGYRPLDRSARWSEFQHTMRREMAARDRRFFGERVVPGVHIDDERAVPPATW